MIKTREIVTVFRVRGDGLWPVPDAERLYHQLTTVHKIWRQFQRQPHSTRHHTPAL